MKQSIYSLMIACLTGMVPIWSATYYIDPVNGHRSHTGRTRNSAWQRLEAIFKSNILKSGDRILLASGYHGEIRVVGGALTDISIEGLEGEIPHFGQLRISNTQKWRFRGITISPEGTPKYTRRNLVDISRNCRMIDIENCRLRSVKDISEWERHDWVDKSCQGIVSNGQHIRIRNNTLLNIDHGITINGPHSVVEKNLIENFSGDGIRVLADHSTVRRNVIKNCYAVDKNHDDGIQSWSVGENGVGSGAVKHVMIEGNLIINYSNPRQKYRGTLQGIGCFDGFYEDWTIANNIIIIDHYHGISLYGARRCTIINNTVIDQNDQRPGPPWIMITKHKKGTASSDNLIRNNLACKLTSRPDVGRIDHNQIVSDVDTFFVDRENFDLRLKSGSPAIDAGFNRHCSEKDYLGQSRIQGERVDIGACEFAEPK